ncbi:MAG: GtrA family protein [Calditrichaeota bacterium]|nr:GtrA family protein [Calditrichota bacterium]
MITDLISQNRERFLKFFLVGAVGVLVNQGILILLHDYRHLSLSISSPVAIEFSILSNFLFNNNWTWKSSKSKSLFKRITNYHLVSLISGALNYAVLLGLTMAGLFYMWANLIGIAVAALLNFVLNHTWTFAESLNQSKLK